MEWISPKIETILSEADIEHMSLLGDWEWSGQGSSSWSGQNGNWSGQGGKWSGQR